MATRWGIASAGRISHDFVTAVSVLSPEEHNVVAVAARSLDRAKEFADKHNIPKAYSSYEQLAADADIDVVYIGNINTEHLPTALMMVNSGKHVLCEKPLCLNKIQAQKLIDAAQQKKVFLMEAIWSRFTPIYERLRKELESNTIGDIVNLNVTFGVPIAKKERIKLRDLGGGSILDIGVYCLQLAILVFGNKPPSQVRAAGTVSVGESVDESVGAVLLYEGGRMANISVHSCITLPNEAIITGTKGAIKIPCPFWCPTELVTPTETVHVELPSARLPFNFQNSVQLRHEAEEVRRCILAGELQSPLMSHEDSLALASLEDQLRRLIGVQYAADIQ